MIFFWRFSLTNSDTSDLETTKWQHLWEFPEGSLKFYEIGYFIKHSLLQVEIKQGQLDLW